MSSESLWLFNDTLSISLVTYRPEVDRHYVDVLSDIFKETINERVLTRIRYKGEI